MIFFTKKVMNTYSETINFLYNQFADYHKQGLKAYKSDLYNISEIVKHLGHPENRLMTIHIAGTNGKGSVSNIIASCLQSAGYKVGLFTSPHIIDFRERIRINGIMISKQFVIEFTEKIKYELIELNPSFFEITTAMAFEYFAQNKVDYAIIEVGLGGRLDSTNIINPLVSVITNIGYDHLLILGETIEKIAFEKAGIIKNFVPVVVGKNQTETMHLFSNIARSKNAEIFFAQDNQEIKNFASLINCDLKGFYQSENIVTAIQTIEILKQKGLKITYNQIISGCENVVLNTGFAGRWQIYRKEPLVVLDIAHNLEGWMWLVKQLEQFEKSNIHIIIGFVNDKDVSGVIKILPKLANYYITEPDNERKLPKEKLFELAQLNGLKCSVFYSVKESFEIALKNSNNESLILISGSNYLVADFLK